MPKNLGNISDPKDIVTLEYLEQNCVLRSQAPRLVVGTTIVDNISSTVSIPENIDSDREFLIYHNGLLLINQLNYTRNSDSINLLSYTASPGDAFTFIDIVID